MKKGISKKDKEFMKKFVSLYFKRRELDLFLEKDKKNIGYKNKIKKLDSQIRRILPKYAILFENNLNVLFDVFGKVAKEEKATFITNDFKSFLRWTLDRLHEEKIINKKTYEVLSQYVVRLNFNLRLPGSILWKG